MTSPIIMGISGLAGTGKTSVAETIVPKGRIAQKSELTWDHIFFALPLYELASIKLNVRGLRERDRQLYEIHSVLYELYGGSPIGDVPDYNDLIELVHAIHALPIEEDRKPRSFLQKAGDLCREIRPDCFATWAVNKSKQLHRDYLRITAEEDVTPFIVIISDVRFVNEAKTILKQENSVLVNFSASDQIRFERLMGRDGYLMSEEQRQHRSENEMDLIKDLAHVVIDTDYMSIEDQSLETISYMKERVMNYA
jgi:dephospho-CoA kinase